MCVFAVLFLYSGSFSDVKTSRDTSAGSRGRGSGRGSGSGVGRGRGGAQRGGPRAGQNARGAFVTSSGLFSEGAGDGVTRRSMSRFRSSNDTSDSTQLRKPTIIKREKLDPSVEESHIRDIYELDSELMDDDKSSNDSFSPINLMEGKCPLDNSDQQLCNHVNIQKKNCLLQLNEN